MAAGRGGDEFSCLTHAIKTQFQPKGDSKAGSILPKLIKAVGLAATSDIFLKKHLPTENKRSCQTSAGNQIVATSAVDVRLVTLLCPGTCPSGLVRYWQ